MTKRMILAMLCIVSLVYTPVAAPTAATAAVLGQVMVSGQAKINGTVTPSGATVFPGDRVATEAHTVAELVLSGGSKVLLPESTAVVVNKEAARVIVDLQAGSLAVLSKSKVPAFIDANGARIKPLADAPVVLEVAVQGNSLKVLAHRGSATIETAGKVLEVPEGKELDATMTPASPNAPQIHSAGWSSLETWVLIGAAGAGLTGLILGIVAVTRPNPADCTVVSPSGAGALQCP